MTTYGKNMKLFTSYWSDKTTFKLMPLVEDCPYTEVIYDPASTLLVVISKQKHQKFQMMERLDESGNPIPTKKPKMNGKPWAEQRLILEVLQEYYIVDEQEQIEFIKEFAINADTFDYTKFFHKVDENASLHIPEKQGLLDTNGMPMKAAKKTPIKV
jgi:hypothetical protein